ncbi:TetR/AcrR family transcriptional regulator [Tomitella fengzijianii]|uniref:TetR/AcrR family transcriptional regulator n=1 Tax=Tomitella fengzijianii TaxID=2597660 RepID=UPI00131D7BDE|nr:TetR/AcrR family transcriptional regulator [Tomitella fengzijianii]
MEARTASGESWDEAVSDHRRRQLLHIGRAATALVAAEGLAAVSMSRLAREAGVSRATLYNYVPDVATAIQRYLDAKDEAFARSVTAAVADEPGPVEKLRRYIREQVRYVAGGDHRAAVAVAEAGAALEGASSARAHQARQPAVLAAILAEGEEAGVFAPAAHGARAMLIGRLLYSAPELLFTHGLSEDEAAAAITDLALGGIAAGG